MRVLIFGDGPAARLATIAVQSSGGAVVRALPRSGLGPPPTERHTHVISDDLHLNAASIDAGLATALRDAVEPDWKFRWDTGAEWKGHDGGHLSRDDIVAALDRRLAQLPHETWRDVRITGRHGDRLEAERQGHRRTFDLVIDATGAHRATRAMLHMLAPPTRLQDVGRHALYQSFELSLPAPAGKIQWGCVPLNDPLGALYGFIDGGRMRVTTSVDPQRTPATSVDDIGGLIGARAAALIPHGARVLRRTSTVAPQFRRLVYRAEGMPDWVAIGDARMQMPPRMGNGLGTIFRQCRLLAEALREGGGAAAVRGALDSYIDKTWDLNMKALRMSGRSAGTGPAPLHGAKEGRQRSV